MPARARKPPSAVPPPLILVDSQGNVTQVLQGAASGSGIGALQPAGGTAGDVDLIAPKGTVNAGDAGIRAGNLNIAGGGAGGGQHSVSGSSTGTPVADTSAVTAASIRRDQRRWRDGRLRPPRCRTIWPKPRARRRS